MRETPFTHDELKTIGRGGTDQFNNNSAVLASALAQEVQYQREWLAYTARVIEAQTLDLKGLAKCRRNALEKTVDNLRALVRGGRVAENRRSLESEYERVMSAVSLAVEGEQ